MSKSEVYALLDSIEQEMWAMDAARLDDNTKVRSNAHKRYRKALDLLARV